MGWLKWIRDVLWTLDGLIRLEKKHGASIENLDQRTSRLEAHEPLLIAEAKTAAATAASIAATQHVADLARRVGTLEEQVRQLMATSSRKRLT